MDRYLNKKFGRLRNVVEAADGKLYKAVSGRTGDPLMVDDRIISMTQGQIKKWNIV